jgi:hypothetical protein
MGLAIERAILSLNKKPKIKAKRDSQGNVKKATLSILPISGSVFCRYRIAVWLVR